MSARCTTARTCPGTSPSAQSASPCCPSSASTASQCWPRRTRACGVPIRSHARDLALRLLSRLICTINLNAFRDDGHELERVHLQKAIAGQISDKAQVAGLVEHWHPTRVAETEF